MSQIVDAAFGAHGGGSPVDLLVGLFALAIVPLLAVGATSFTRVVVVLGLLRTSIGTPSLPPNIVMAALALMLTAVIMGPTLAKVQTEALVPLGAHQLTPSQAAIRAAAPLRAFMLRQTRPRDIEAFARMAGDQHPDVHDPSLAALAPAFLVGELRAAFAMGFALALPFAVVDVVVAAVLMSLGMFMVSPASIALPLKLLLFVVADGWALVAGAIVASYR